MLSVSDVISSAELTSFSIANELLLVGPPHKTAMPPLEIFSDRNGFVRAHAACVNSGALGNFPVFGISPVYKTMLFVCLMIGIEFGFVPNAALGLIFGNTHCSAPCLDLYMLK